MPVFEDLLLWGVPLLTLVGALESLIQDLTKLSEKTVKLIGAVLFGGAIVLVLTLPDLLVLYPDIEKWGQIGMWALAAMLVRGGYLKRLVKGVTNALAR